MREAKPALPDRQVDPGGPRHRNTLKGVETGFLELSVLLLLELHMNLILSWTLDPEMLGALCRSQAKDLAL